MEVMYTFGFKLAELLGKGEAAGLGLLVLAVRDAGKNSQKLTYAEFSEILNVHLRRRMEKMNIVDRDRVIVELQQFLTEKQSLFAMVAR